MSGMIGINKIYYQQAAAEAASGHVDQALWVKIRADNPDAEDVALQARYIQARAKEMAAEAVKNGVRRKARSFGESLFYLAALVALFGGGGYLLDLQTTTKTGYETLAKTIAAANEATGQSDQNEYDSYLHAAQVECKELSDVWANTFDGLIDDANNAQIARERCDRVRTILGSRAEIALDNLPIEADAQNAINQAGGNPAAGASYRSQERPMPMPTIQ
jgi:hypothetical protein